MASFRIPKAHHPVLAKLLGLENASKQKLLSALRDFPSAATPEVLAKGLSAATDIPSDDITQIITVLISMNSLRTYLDLETPDLVKQVCEAMIETGEPELALGADDQEPFANYLGQLLETRSLIISSKVVDVWSEHDRSLCGVRIFTDVRPVFGDENNVLATGIVHMLKLSYHETDGIKEIYIAMDDDDLEKLTDAIEYASTRSKNVKSVLSEAKIAQFE